MQEKQDQAIIENTSIQQIQSISVENQVLKSSISTCEDQKFAFDTINQEYLCIQSDNFFTNNGFSQMITTANLDSTQNQEPNSNICNGKIIFYDQNGNKNKILDLSDLQQFSKEQQQDASQQIASISDHLSEESECKRQHQFQMFGDNWSVLRFIKGKQSKKTLEISPSGFSLNITKGGHGGKKQNIEELVLTNMIFYSGLHFWEIYAPISCNNIQLGVYNPITCNEVLTSFKTTTPRIITVCLDLNENMLKFWLNDRRNSNKNIKLPINAGDQGTTMGGPWIPCVKIDKEWNKVVLNPFAKEPSDFYEKDFDKKFTIHKLVMPFLYNMILVTNLPVMSQQSKEAAHQLKQLFSLSSQNINQILMPLIDNLISSTEQIQTNEQQSNLFCFIQFHYFNSMVEFINKYSKEGKFKIYSPYEIASLFTNNTDIPQQLKGPFQVISDHIQYPSKFKITLPEAVTSINNAYQFFVKNKKEISQHQSISNQQNYQLSLSHQQYCDKLIVIKESNSVKLIARDPSTNDFDITSTNFSECPLSLTSYVTLSINQNLVEKFFQTINWSQLLKDDNPLVFSIVYKFFTDIVNLYTHKQDNSKQTVTESEPSITIFKTNLIIAKFFIEFATQQAKSQIDRIRRNQSNYSTVIQTPSLINRNKPEYELDIIKQQDFYYDHNHSVDDLYLLLSILNDLTEQLWCFTRSARCPPDVKQLMTSIARPSSALNRLGSYIQWGLNRNLCPLKMCNNGMFFKENMTIGQYQNGNIEISELSKKGLSDIDILEEMFGSGNRLMNSYVNENIQLHKSLNYLSPQKLFQYQISNIISSQNSGFVLIGGQQGIINISHALLDLMPLKTLSFFQNDLEKKQKKYKEIIHKIEMRKLAFDSYKESICKKSVVLSIAKDLKIKTDEKDSETINKQAKKKQQKLLKLNKAKLMKQKAHEQLLAEIKSTQGTGSQKEQALMEKVKKFKKEHPKDKVNLTSLQKPPPPITQIQQKEKKQDQTIKEEQKQKQISQIEKVDQFSSKILGYIMLSKPSYDKAIDPLIVGCVYYNIKNQTFCVKMRKIIFLLHYLQNFISIDPNSGQQINRISGKHMVDTNDYKALYEEILNHSDVVVDLYPIFMRNQALKKDWPKKDQKFQILTDIYEDQIEIPDCVQIIDFDKCSYSIHNQNKFHFIIESKIKDRQGNNQIKLIQYGIKEDEEQKNLLDLTEIEQEKQDMHKIKIEKINEVVLEQLVPLRVFQFENKVLILEQNYYTILSQDSLQVEQKVKLNQIINESQARKAIILNKTEESKMYNRQNLEKFNNKKLVQEQDWRLVIDNPQDTLQLYQLINQQDYSLIQKQKTIKVNKFDINTLEANDILQIGNLLESKYIGTIANKANYVYNTSSCLDYLSNQYTHHSWHILEKPKNNQAYEFSIKIPQVYKQSHLRELSLEFSFRKKQQIQIDLQSFKNDKIEQEIQQQDSKQLKKIPLLIEEFSGAQMSDSVQPCFVTYSDNLVFSSNYPQPEYIFKHYQSKTFIPKQFIIKSKENREWNGVPISQGLIFMADSLEDLSNTKQFSKFTEQEYKQWKQKRDQYSQIPLLPCEPVAFFDLDDQTEIIVSFNNLKSCRYVKFIPTAFRRKPINFTSKPFNSNQVEFQFFGINGIEIKSDHRGIGNINNYDNIKLIKELEVQLNTSIIDKVQNKKIGLIDKVYISEIRNAKPQNTSLPIIALASLSNNNIIGVAKQSILFKEEDISDSIETIIIIEIQNKVIENEQWELSGVTLAVKAFSDSNVIFKNQALAENKPRLRHYLLDPSQFGQVLEQFVKIIQEQEPKNEEMKMASLQSILVFLKSVSYDKNKYEFMNLFKESTQIDKILNDNFIEYNQSYQVLVLRYLEQISILQSNQEFISQFIQQQIGRFLSKCWDQSNLQVIFDLMQWCKSDQKIQIYQQLIKTFFVTICQEILPKYQSEHYILLRSKLNICAFPFDNSLISILNQDGTQNFRSQNRQNKTIDGHLSLLNCSFEISKINTLYHYKVDFKNISLVEKMKLFFEYDQKSLYKIGIKVIVPDINGSEQIYLIKHFDENTFANVCERAHKEDNIKYFNSILNDQQQASTSVQDQIQLMHSSPKKYEQSLKKLSSKGSSSAQQEIEVPQIKDDKQESQSIVQQPSSLQTMTDQLDLNSIELDLHGFVGRYIKIQVELLDSYRTVHKPTGCTQIFIRPEFYGQVISLQQQFSEQSNETEKYNQFKISTPNESYLLKNQTFGNIQYQLYQIPHHQLSRLNKALLMVMPESINKQVKTQQQVAQIDESKLVDLQKQLSILRNELKEILDDYVMNSQSISKNQIQNKVDEIGQLQKDMLNTGYDTNNLNDQLSLSYILSLSDLLCQQISVGIKQNTNILIDNQSIGDLKQTYIKLFTKFGIQDQLKSYPNVQKLLDFMFEKITDKSRFMFQILQEFVFENQKQTNQTNILEFIQSSQLLEFNELIQNYLQYIVDSKEEQEVFLDNIESEDHVQIHLNRLQSINKLQITNKCQINQMLLLLKIIDDINIEQKAKVDSPIQLDLMFKLLSKYIYQNYSQIDFQSQKFQLVIQYSLSIIQKCLLLNEKQYTFKLDIDCQIGILLVIIVCVQMNSKSSLHQFKAIAIEITKKNNSMMNLIGALVQWYKNKENQSKYDYYIKLEESQTGKGSSYFIKHLSMVFKLFMKVLNNSRIKEIELELAYQQLGDIMTDVLQSLTTDKNETTIDINETDNFSIVWTQLYKSLNHLDSQTLAQNDVFLQLANKFYKLPLIMQESLYPKFLQKSEKFIEQQTSKDPSVIIQIIKAFLIEGFHQQQNIKIAFCFCEGLLNIISSGKKDVVSAISINCKFSTSAIHQLLSIMKTFLQAEINKGVYLGVTGSYLETIMRLDIGIQISNILTNAQDTNKENAYDNYIKQPCDNKIEIIHQLLDWLFLNSQYQKGKSSPAAEKMYLLSFQIEGLLNKVAISDEMVFQSLPILMNIVQKIDNKLSNLLKVKAINNERAIQLQKICNTLFCSLFKTWVQNDNIAKKFLTDLNGFDFLLDRLFGKKDNKEENIIQINDQSIDNEEQNDELTELINNIKAKVQQTNKIDPQSPIKIEKKSLPITLPPISKKQTAIIPSVKYEEEDQIVKHTNKEVEQQLNSEDFGRSMKLIWSSDKGKGVAAVYATTQWNKFKNGTKNRVYNFQITDQKYEYEYALQFDLEKVIQISEIEIGLLYSWSTYEVDCQYEPLSFIIEGGIEKEQTEWKVLLTPVYDAGYMVNSIIVYGHSFIENKYHNSIESVLESIQCKECRYLTFKLRKPLTCCLESSLQVACLKKIKSYGISFISVQGIAIEDNVINPYLINLQKDNSLEVLSKFFSGEFTGAFELMAEQPSIIQKIKNAFDKLSKLLDNKAALIKPIFLSICSKNQELSNWIISQRLISIDEFAIKKEQIKFLGDIISSSKDTQFDKLNKLKEFIIEQINFRYDDTLGQLSQEQQILFSRYINLYCSKLREYSQYLVSSDQLSQKEIEIQYNVKDLGNLVSLMNTCGQGKSKLFISLNRFALLLLLPPKPFVNNIIQINEYVDKLLTSKEEKHQLQYLLFSSIIASNNEKALNTIINLGKIEWVMSILKKEQQELNDIESYQCEQVLYNCSKQNKFRDMYRKTLTYDLYNIMKESKQKNHKIIKKTALDEHIKQIVQTIKDIIIGDKQEEEKLTDILKQDIVIATECQDFDFIKKIIVPILHAEHNIPFCVSIYDKSQCNQKELKPIYNNQQVEGKNESFFLKTSLLSQSQKVTLAKQFKNLSGDKVENFNKLVNDTKWDCIFQSKTSVIDSSKFKTFVQATQNKSNIMILVHCLLNGVSTVFGGFSAKQFPNLGDQWAHEFDYQIPYDDANFVFYYTPEKELHYIMTHNKPFGYIYTDYEQGGALSVSGDFFLLSWSYEFQNSCGNIYDMKCVEDGQSAQTFYSNMEIQTCEIWWANNGSKAVVESGKLKHELKNHRFYKDFSPYNYFRQNLIFEVNDQMKLSQIAQEILSKNQVFIKYPSEEEIGLDLTIKELQQQLTQEGLSDCILNLVVTKKDIIQSTRKTKTVRKKEKDEIQEALFGEPSVLLGSAEKSVSPFKSFKIDSQQQESPVLDPVIEQEVVIQTEQIQGQPILQIFESKGGILDLIKAAKQAVKLYKNEKLREMWGLWLAEIESFSQLPTFFTTFSTQDREKESIVYQLLNGEIDKKLEELQGGIDKVEKPEEIQRIIRQQEELHIEMVKYAYQIVNEVFDKHDGAELRDMCFKNGTFERFIERIGQLSSEKKRVKLGKDEIENHQKEINAVDKQNQIKQGDKDKKKSKEDPYKKRKGVGYTTGVGTQWNVNEYLKSKEAKSAQAANIVNIIKNVIKSKDWETPLEIKNLLLESALLPTLESAFRSGSLLEMAKEFELNMSYLCFVEEIVEHQSLVDLLLEISDEYQPVQKEPVYKLLQKLGDLSQIFLGCLKTDDQNSKLGNDQDQKPKLLAEKIQQANKKVKLILVQQAQIKQQQSLEEILAMPLSQAYFKLLSPLLFEYMSMKDSSNSLYLHSYQNELPKNTNPPITKLIRLAQEIADLSNSLPCDYMNGVFCRVDKERVDLMKCMIMGASGTPYAHGAFVYDLFFENNYPNVPPKCQLTTTGGQTVRFNPNLYNNGKVCLSLLGTWRGSSTENWDPKLSTILQVVLSIQAIIMSNEVYFNEPGYEHEAGTPEGEKKNEGYANIVRYCNIKFAIIDAIKNPPKGFEKVIKRNFYLKKNEVLREVKEWVDRSKTTEALYTGLVYDHNYTWAPQISQPGKYAELMEQIYQELKETLESIKSPFEDESTGLTIERKFSKADQDEEDKSSKKEQPIVNLFQKDQQFENIDVSYDQPIKSQDSKQQVNQTININDDKVKDRWSRYIGAMGIEAVAKQAESRILIMGLGPLGVEIAKNIVLAGCKELILYDNKIPTIYDLSGGQFFLSEKDINQKDYTRADLSKDKLQQLNYYVKVSNLPSDTNIAVYLSDLDKSKEIRVVVMALDALQVTRDMIYQVNKVCRKMNIAFIRVCQNGLFCHLFNDFGGLGVQSEEKQKDFIVIDKDGEELQEVMIENITENSEGEGIVVLQQGFKHKFQDGDQVIIKEVKGMTQQNVMINIQQEQEQLSINNTIFTVTTINPQSFKIGNIQQYTKYEGGGLAKQIKTPKVVQFKTYEEIEEGIEETRQQTDKKQDNINIYLDQNLMIADYEKIDNITFSFWCYSALLTLIQDLHNEQYIFGQDTFFEDIEFQFAELVRDIAGIMKYDLVNKDNSKKLTKFMYTFLFTLESFFQPLSAYMGGIASQEIIKAITQKFVPINQQMFFDTSELFPKFDCDTAEQLFQVNDQIRVLKKDRYHSLRVCLGYSEVDLIHNAKVFMIGAGAIGCELLKNYAILGIGIKNEGHIILTDPDVIETSNLNRQFLFREKHLRMPKSQIAAAAAIQMNSDLKGHINARLDKIHDSTSHIYNEAFFLDQNVITNALDNVQARLYIDSKCISARIPLIDSGTLGPKGHVQMIIPFKTESYASQNDPEDNTQIPHCTLKMFPEETLHCVEWAKDIFGKLFTLQSQNYNKLVFTSDQQPNYSDQQELVQIKGVIKTIEKRPIDFNDCIKMARFRFQKHFSNDILQLLHVYPLDKLNKDGRPFWSLPKRPPHPLNFDLNNDLHISFIASTSCLYATIYNIKIPYENPRSDQSKQEMAKIAQNIHITQFIPNDMKAQEIQQQVEKQANKDEEQEEEQKQSQPKYDIENIKSKFQNLVIPLRTEKDKSKIEKITMKVEEFEKDVDQNYHVDFIYSMANLRASNYKLDPMDWLTVKIKAGRIIPALATTTAAIAALQTIELIKAIKNCDISMFRNSFLNLAVPSLMMSEPGAPVQNKIKDNLSVSLWDRWEYTNAKKDSTTLNDIAQFFEEKYNLINRDIFHESTPLFLHTIQDQKEKNKTLDQFQVFHVKEKFVELAMTFVDKQAEKDEKGQEIIIKGVPIIRVYFGQE